MHPTAYERVYDDGASGGGGTSGDVYVQYGRSGAWEPAGGSAVEKKKPRLGEASQDNVK